MASSVSTITCGFCGRSADAPMREANTDGTLRFACVGEHHEPHAEAIGGDYPAFLARARNAGLDGKW